MKRKIILAMIVFWSAVAIALLVVLVGRIRYSGGGNTRIIGAANGPASIFLTKNHNAAELLYDESFDTAGLNEIKVDLGADAVEILPATDGHIRIVQYGVNLQENRVIAVERSASKLTVNRQKRAGFDIGFHFGGKSHVEVYLPGNYQETLALELASGSIDISTDLKLKELTIHLSSGSIRSANSLTAENAGLNVASGNIGLAELDTGYFDIRISSGDVAIERISGSGKTKVASGHIRLDSLTLTEALEIDISSGDVDIGLAGNPNLRLKGNRSSGSVRAYFDLYVKDGDRHGLFGSVGSAPYKEIDISVSSGSVNIYQSDL